MSDRTEAVLLEATCMAVHLRELAAEEEDRYQHFLVQSKEVEFFGNKAVYNGLAEKSRNVANTLKQAADLICRLM